MTADRGIACTGLPPVNEIDGIVYMTKTIKKYTFAAFEN